MFCLPPALPAPNISLSFSGYSIAGQDYSLQCSASVVDGLVVLPDLKIVFPNSTEISVMNTSSLDYMFSPLRTSDGGQYTCTATVNIPQAGITDLQSSVIENITVVGKCCRTCCVCIYTSMYVYQLGRGGTLGHSLVRLHSDNLPNFGTLMHYTKQSLI